MTHRISDKAAACNFIAHANIYRHRADHAATVTKRLPSQLGRARQLERFGVLNSRLVELEELAAIGQASDQHAQYHYEAKLRIAYEVELAQREELMRLRARLNFDKPAVSSDRQAL